MIWKVWSQSAHKLNLESRTISLHPKINHLTTSFSFVGCQDQLTAIPGQPGKDYPNLTEVPRTSFSCDGLSPGYYADQEGQCQVYHRCTHGNAGPSFTRLCPIGKKINKMIRGRY